MNLPCTFQTAQLIENLRIVLNFSSQSSKHTIYFATLPFLLEPFIVFVSFYTEKTVVIRQISTKLVSLFKTIDSKHQRMSRIFCNYAWNKSTSQQQEREIFFMFLEICTIQDIPCFHYKLCYLFNFSNFPTIYTKDLEMFLSVDIFIDHAQKSSQS